jgi:hypothetical protein
MLGISRQHRRVAVVDDAKLGERVDPSLEVRTGRARRGANRPGGEPRPGPVGDEVVGRGTEDRDVGALEVLRLLCERRAAEREEPGVIRLVGERAPAGEWVDRHSP